MPENCFEPLFRYAYILYESVRDNEDIQGKINMYSRMIKGYFFVQNFQGYALQRRGTPYIPEELADIFALAFHLHSIIFYDRKRLDELVNFLSMYQSLYDLPEIIHYEGTKEYIFPVAEQKLYTEFDESKKTLDIDTKDTNIVIVENVDYKRARQIVKSKKGVLMPIPKEHEIEYGIEYISVPKTILDVTGLQTSFSYKTTIYEYKDGSEVQCREIVSDYDLAFYFIRSDTDSWCLIDTKLIKQDQSTAEIRPVKIYCQNCTFYDLQVFVHICNGIVSKNISQYQVKHDIDVASKEAGID